MDRLGLDGVCTTDGVTEPEEVRSDDSVRDWFTVRVGECVGVFVPTASANSEVARR